MQVRAQIVIITVHQFVDEVVYKLNEVQSFQALLLHYSQMKQLTDYSMDCNGGGKIFLYNLLLTMPCLYKRPYHTRVSTTNTPLTDWCGLPAGISPAHSILF